MRDETTIVRTDSDRDDTILLGCGFFELARFKPCRRLRTHHAEDSVTLSSNMQKYFSKGPGVGWSLVDRRS